jgi:hypothetical protein
MADPDPALTGAPATAVQKTGLVLIPVLLVVYAAPLWVVAIASLGGAFNGSTMIGKWFISLVIAPDSALNLFQRVLLPLTAGVTVGVMWRGEHQKWTVAMAAFVLLSIVCAIYMMVLLGIPDVLQNLWQQADNEKVTTSEQMNVISTTFIGRMQESLATYLLVLLGLQAIPKTS